MKYLCLVAVLLIALSAPGAFADDAKDSTVKNKVFSEWPDQVLTAIIWMNVERKVPYHKMRFDPPGSESFDQNVRYQLFHPEGGNVPYQLSEYNNLPYIFTTKNALKDMETEETEMLAILTGIDPKACNNINETLDFPRQDLFSSFFERLKDDDNKYNYVPEISEMPSLDYVGHEKNQSPNVNLDITSKRGCYKVPGDQYYYVHMLIQR